MSPLERFIERLRAGEGRERGVQITWARGKYARVECNNGKRPAPAPETDVVYPAGLSEAA